MFSSQFLISYCFFTAAITAYRGTPEDVRDAPEVKAVADAFSKATVGLSKKEQQELRLFLLRLIQQPEEFSHDKYHRSKIESALDKEITNQFPAIINDEHLIIEADFLARAGITKEVLSQKLREHRIFSIAEWVHKDLGESYYPAFFVNRQYDLSSLEAVSIALRASPSERKYRFFTTPVAALGNKTPLEVIASGKLKCVVDAAKAFRRRTIPGLGDN